MAGWTGSKCNTGCLEGFFGLNCSQMCMCQNGATCGKVDGKCTCIEGYTGNRYVARKVNSIDNFTKKNTFTLNTPYLISKQQVRRYLVDMTA